MRKERWQHALDVQMDYHKWCSHPRGHKYNEFFFQDVLSKDSKTTEMYGPEHVIAASELLANHLVTTLWQGDTMYVTADMLHLLMAAAEDLPADITFDEHTLITPCGFCLFEEPIQGIDRQGLSILFHGIAWKKDIVKRSDGFYDPATVDNLVPMIIVYFLVDPMDDGDDYSYALKNGSDAYKAWHTMAPLTLQHFYPAKLGGTVPDQEDVPGTKMITNTLRIFLAMQLLAQQKIGEPMQLRPDRATRRRVQREWDKNERMITLITLRRKSVKKDDHEPGQVEWSRRWAVRGHWRKQYYPKTKTHDWKYIFGYIKGPDDKPFIPPDRRIFDFRR